MSESLPQDVREPAASAAPPAVNGHLATGFDLLRLRIVCALVRWPGFPRFFQVMALVVFVGLAIAAWGVFTPAGVNAKLFARANLATLAVWGLWWPAMVWVAVLFGRVWCAVCPLELVGKMSERGARWLGFPQRPLPRWIASGALIVALYAGIQLLVAGAHIHRVPAYTSLFLTGLFGLSLLAGFVFRDRAFCRGFCPVGALLNVYGRGAVLAVRPGPADTGSGPMPDARTCPSLLNPARLASNEHCLVCGRCLQAAAPGRMRLLLRRPFPAADARVPVASWPLTLFVMLVSGFVIGELFTEWPVADKVFLAAPVWLAAALGAPAQVDWFEGVWCLALVPLALWSLLAGLAWIFGARRSFGALWREMALPLVVVISAGHLAKGLAKFVSWAPFLPGALRDSVGVATAQAITAKAVAAPAPWLSINIVAAVSAALIATAWVFSMREYRLAQRPRALPVSAMLPLAIIALGFLGIVAGWTLR